jgi:hypothetical protein
MSLLPPSLVLPFHGQLEQLRSHSHISIRNTNKEIAELLPPNHLKLGGEASVSSICLTTGLVSYNYWVQDDRLSKHVRQLLFFWLAVNTDE